jgi:hypothetical protein
MWWQLLHAHLLGATSRRLWLLPVLASWRPGRCVWCGPPSSGITEELYTGMSVALNYCCARPYVGSPRHPWPRGVTCSLPRLGLHLLSWGRHPPTWLSPSYPSVACCLSLQDPSCSAVQARSRSGVSTCSRDRGLLVKIIVACMRWCMSGNQAVSVDKLRAGASNCQPAAPITFSPRP